MGVWGQGHGAIGVEADELDTPGHDLRLAVLAGAAVDHVVFEQANEVRAGGYVGQVGDCALAELSGGRHR